MYGTQLPSDVYNLSKMCLEKLPEYVDFNGKLLWAKNEKGQWEVICNYMKPEHRGKPLSEAIKIDPEYFKWVVFEPKEFDYSDKVKEIVRNAMNGIYPSRNLKMHFTLKCN